MKCSDQLARDTHLCQKYRKTIFVLTGRSKEKKNRQILQ